MTNHLMIPGKKGEQSKHTITSFSHPTILSSDGLEVKMLKTYLQHHDLPRKFVDE